VKVEATDLPGVVVVESPVYGDSRGYFTEVFHAERFAEMGLPVQFPQDNHSRSARHVLRGLHFQLHNPQGKLVRPVTGTVFDVAVDIRRSSPTFAKWTGVTLVAGDGRQLDPVSRVPGHHLCQQRGDARHGRAGVGHFAGLRSHDQVDIACSDASFGKIPWSSDSW